MNADLTKTETAQQPPVEDDFFSDAPLVTCPLRKDGLGEDEICESCQ
tara:strand:- start:3134 stop:3274 length:141 start_codon:yes stop_codon:yes gene_type:complete